MPGPGEFPAETQKNDAEVGLQHKMKKQPISSKISDGGDDHLISYKPADKLKGRRALITGGDSGIGRSVALFYAKEGADVAIAYLPAEQKDAEDTLSLIREEVGAETKCELFSIDIQSEKNCKKLISDTVEKLGGIDILVNNAAYQMNSDNIEDLSGEQLERTFRTNVFAPFFLTKYAVPHMDKGSSIIFSTSVVAYRGSKTFVDYAASKAAMVGMIRSLAQQLSDKAIRVNGVAPGPVWTPLQPISRTAESMQKFGDTDSNLVGRIAQPSEMAPSYVFLASNDSTQFTGQVLHPNSGEILNV